MIRITKIISITAALIPSFWLCSCKDSENTGIDNSSGPPTKGTKAEQKSPEQLAAEKIVADHPNLELVESLDGKIHFQNVHTKLGLILPFQDVIDKKFKSIAGGEAEAAKILRPHKSGTFGSAKGHDTSDWGKVPTWIARPSDTKVLAGAQHMPKKNGAIWGQFECSNSQDLPTLRALLVRSYSKVNMIIDNEYTRGKTLNIIFHTPGGDNNAQHEQRKVVYTLTRKGEQTSVMVQYSYGMK